MADPKEDDVEDLGGGEFAMPGGDITENADGSVEVPLEDTEAELSDIVASQEHFVNLAEDMDETQLNDIGHNLVELIEDDAESRKKRDELYAEGLKRTGLGGEAPGGADFQGASNAVHPMLVEACVDFASRTMKELFPAKGPVKQHIPGTPTKERVEKAERKVKHMNWQTRNQIKEFRAELKQTLTQAPLGGGGYMKGYWNPRYKRPSVEFIAMDDMIYPNAASSFDTAERKTHRRTYTEMEFKRRVKEGIYRDVELITPLAPEETASSKANDKIEGKTLDPMNNDGARTIYETSCWLDFEEEGEYRPYLVTIDQSSEKVLAIYRNWGIEDETFEELQHIVEFPFIQWRGAAPIGLTHLIGNLSGAATGALRALLDSAHINNTPTAFKLQGGVKGGDKVTAKPGEVKDIKGTVGQDDIRKVMMPLPFNQPSPVLFQLLGFLVDAGRGVVQTTFENLAEQKTDMPVGTTLALIEQGMVVFSEIHSCLHNSMGQLLRIIHRINATHLTSEEIKDDLGEVLAKPGDYKGPMDVEPVSDPNIFSEVQRQAQIALIAQRAALMPQLYDMHKVEKMILDYAKFPNAEELLIPAPEPERDNAVNENVKATMGKALVVFPEQDHEAHIKTHIDFTESPHFGKNPAIINGLLPVMTSHIRDHISMWYVSEVVRVAETITKMDLSKLMDEDEMVSKAFDQAMAKASEYVIQQMNSNPTMQRLAPIMQEAMQFVQQNQPPNPVDPGAAAMAEVERKKVADEQKGQIDQANLQAKQVADAQKAQIDQLNAQIKQQELLQKRRDSEFKALEQKNKLMADKLKLQTEQRKIAQDGAHKAATVALDQQKIDQAAVATAAAQKTTMDKAVMDNQTKLAMNTSDNETAMAIADAEIQSGEKVAVSTGGGIDP